MSKGLRMTEAQLADFLKRGQAAQRSVDRRVLEHNRQSEAIKAHHARGRAVSAIEEDMARQIKLAGLPVPQSQFKAIPGRKFAMDLAWPDRKIGLEVQGMVHRIKGRFKQDIEKRALLMFAGWRVLEVGGDEVRNGKALEWTKRLLHVT